MSVCLVHNQEISTHNSDMEEVKMTKAPMHRKLSKMEGRLKKIKELVNKGLSKQDIPL